MLYRRVTLHKTALTLSNFQEERTLTLPIEITAVNDPPEIRLVPGGILRLAQVWRFLAFC